MKVRNLIILTLLAGLLSSCLTVERKEYRFELADANSGKLTIKYINLLSIMDEENDVSEEDFEQLLTDYIEGDQLEKEYPNAKSINKRLFEENGTLCGEVIIEFENLVDAGLYRHDKKSPLMFYINSGLGTETFLLSDGKYGGETMPVVFWDKKKKDLMVVTSVTQPDETTVSLIGEYNKWRE